MSAARTNLVTNDTSEFSNCFTVTPESVIAVTNTDDAGAGSLRQAIIDSNNTAGPDTITFNISGSGPHTIQPIVQFPNITDPVIIDGYTQLGATPNSNGPGLGSNAVLLIEIDGSLTSGGARGLGVEDNSTIRGLVINNFASTSTTTGIVIFGDHNVIEGNFIGTNVAGDAALGNVGSAIM